MNTINEIIHEIDEGTLPDTSRRKALVVATGVMGGIGLLATAAPFVASLQPSERALALGGPVRADVSALEAGQLQTVAWRGKPVWLMRRSESMVRALQQNDSALANPLSKRSDQPRSCVNSTRSLSPDEPQHAGGVHPPHAAREFIACQTNSTMRQIPLLRVGTRGLPWRRGADIRPPPRG